MDKLSSVKNFCYFVFMGRGASSQTVTAEVMLRQNLVSSGGAPNATELKQLIQQARDLELTDLELDGLVYDLTDNNRSIVYNSGDPITGDDYEDLDLLDETSGEIASAINNQGLEEQVAFIATELGVKDASTALNELAA